MRGLRHIAGVKIICRDRAAHRRDADGTPFDAEFLDDLGDQPLNDAVCTAGAVGERSIGEGGRLFKNDSHQ